MWPGDHEPGQELLCPACDRCLFGAFVSEKAAILGISVISKDGAWLSSNEGRSRWQHFDKPSSSYLWGVQF